MHIEWVGAEGAPTPPPITSRAPSDSQAAIDSKVNPRCQGSRFAQQQQSNGHMAVAWKKKKKFGSDDVIQAVASDVTFKEKMGVVPTLSNLFYSAAPTNRCNRKSGSCLEMQVECAFQLFSTRKNHIARRPAYIDTN